VLRDGERLVGEWLMQAHGTRYQLKHEPFVAFDLMMGVERAQYDDLITRVAPGDFVTPTVIHRGGPLSIEAAMKKLNTYGFHGAIDKVEGAVWRVERNELADPAKNGDRVWKVDFLVKYVRLWTSRQGRWHFLAGDQWPKAGLELALKMTNPCY
jgi:hypothetical protein